MSRIEIRKRIGRAAAMGLAVMVFTPIAGHVASQVAGLSAASAQDVGSRIADRVGEGVAARTESTVVEAINERVAAQVNGAVADTVGDRVADQVEEQVATRVSDMVAERVESTVANAVGDRVAQQVSDQVTQQVVDRVDETSRNRIIARTNDSVASTVEDQIVDKTDATGSRGAARDRMDGDGAWRERMAARTAGSSFVQSHNKRWDDRHDLRIRRYHAAKSQDRILRLRNTHSDLIELDPDGAPALRREIVAISPDRKVLKRIQDMGFAVIGRKRMNGIGIELVRLRAPASLVTDDALESLRRIDPEGEYDFNHIYFGSGMTSVGGIGLSTFPEGPNPGQDVRVGLIDGGVDEDHPGLAHIKFTTRSFTGEAYLESDHGTAAAFLVAGRSSGHVAPAPGARIYSADVFGDVPTGGSVFAIAEAFAWLSRKNVSVINTSLVGPHNLALEKIVARVLAQDRVIVAAVGNDGPSAPPLYPAAYDGVLGVTAVDGRNALLLEAARGAHVDVAALGADLMAAGIEGQFLAVRGTSFAAPIITGFLAAHLGPDEKDRLGTAERLLADAAVDMGERGRDPHYGMGLISGQAIIRLSSAQ